jgi:carboxyl-terminal processing protease
MVAELDPHSAYLTPTQFSQFLEDTQGQFAGLGVEVDFHDDRVTVVATMPNSPAEKAGLKTGDQIVAVDGVPITGVRADSIVRRMRGPVGTSITLTIRRAKVSEPLLIKVTRAIVSVPSVEGRLLDGHIAYVRLKVFQEGCYVELLEEIARLGRKGTIKGLILDFRSNPGGLVSEAVAIADELLDRGIIYSARHRGKVVEVVNSNSGDLLENLPLLVLVNAATASSAEIVAGALQDRGRATLIGEPTFGKGSVQSIIELDGGAGLLLTTLRYFTPKGRAIQARGLSPNVLVRNESADQIQREADIAGHLPTEGATTTDAAVDFPTKTSTDSKKSEAISENEDSSNAVVAQERSRRNPPPERTPIESLDANPLRSQDAVLAKGYELLLQQITR